MQVKVEPVSISKTSVQMIYAFISLFVVYYIAESEY